MSKNVVEADGQQKCLSTEFFYAEIFYDARAEVSVIKGYNVYKEILEATVGEVLMCKREPHNIQGFSYDDGVLYLLVGQDDPL